MVTNMPIMYNEPAVGFYIANLDDVNEYNKRGNVCSPDDTAIPISLPIHGVYDDYGGIHPYDFDSVPVRHILKKLNFDSLIDLGASVHDGGRSDNDLVTYDIDVGDIIVKAQVGFVMISGHIYNQLVSPDKIKVDKKYESMKSAILTSDSDSLLKRVGRMSLRLYHCTHIFEDSDKEFDIIEDIYGDSDETIRMLAQAYEERSVLGTSLRKLRKVWAGQSGAGGQSTDWMHHFKLARSIQEHIIKNHKDELYTDESYKILTKKP